MGGRAERGGCPRDHAAAIWGLGSCAAGWRTPGRNGLRTRQPRGSLLRRVHGALQLGPWGIGRRMRCGILVLGCSTCSHLVRPAGPLALFRLPSLNHTLPEL